MACNQLSALGDAAISNLMTKIPYSLRERIENKTLDDDLSPRQQVDLFIKVCDRQATLGGTHELRTSAHSDQGPSTQSSGKGHGHQQSYSQGAGINKYRSPTSYLLEMTA